MKFILQIPALLLSFMLLGQPPDTSIFKAKSDSVNPWTHLDFYNNPENFQFAIVSDRTGDHRPGIFEDGIRKVNLIMPEFVVSVGDLIEGYTRNQAEIDKQWREFTGFVNQLEMPFFYLPGNHDVSNEEMVRDWKKRFGRNYYHFVYRNVLFLMMDSNSGRGTIDFGDEQISYFMKIIRENPNVRWTFVLMHHPVWVYRQFNRFDKIEEALNARKYSVIAGHHHHYLYSKRNERNYYVLGTTGGGSEMRGIPFGEFDHITWVTMKDEGPLMVNLNLDGFLPHDVVTEAHAKLSRSLNTTVKDFNYFLALSPDNMSGDLRFHVMNSAEKTLNVNGAFFHHHQLSLFKPKFQVSVPPGGEVVLPIEIQFAKMPELSKTDPIILQWSMGYEGDSLNVSLKGTLNIPVLPSQEDLIKAEYPTFHDELTVTMDRKNEMVLRYTLDGAEPSFHSSEYSSPIVITQSTTVKACLFSSDGKHQGAVQSKYFEKKSPLPTISVNKKLLKKGLSYRYFEGMFKKLSDVDTSQAVITGSITTLDPAKVQKRADHFAIHYSGFIKIPQEGQYTLFTSSNDGSKLYIDGHLVVDNDGLHPTQEKSGYVILEKGLHSLLIEYFDNTSENELELLYKTESLQKMKVPESWLFRY